jgi:hypothetical protein
MRDSTRSNHWNHTVGRRVAKRVGTASATVLVRTWVYNGNELVGEYDAVSGQVTTFATRVEGGDNTAYALRGSTVYALRLQSPSTSTKSTTRESESPHRRSMRKGRRAKSATEVARTAPSGGAGQTRDRLAIPALGLRKSQRVSSRLAPDPYEAALAVAQRRGRGWVVRARSLLEQSIRAGDVRAVYALGTWIYWGSHGLARRPRVGAKMFELAARAGVPDAQNDLAACYEQGIGKRRDCAQARYWLRRAAKGGAALAQCRLAYAYARGECGLRQSARWADHWIGKAAAQGHPYALAWLAEAANWKDASGTRRR